MNFDAIFTAFYTLFRADSDVPVSGDDEYTVGMRLANEAIKRWENYEATRWRELYVTAQTASTGATLTIATGDTTYPAPTAMKEAGGFIKLLNGSTVQSYIPIVEPHEVQFLSENRRAAYFTGNPTAGFVLNLNRAPTSSENGLSIDYVYYKKATEFTTGASTTEMSNPYFIVHRMLGQQFRAARNPYYSSALRDAEDALKNMKLDNEAGTWSNPMTQTDKSGSMWGAANGSGSFFG